VSGGVTVKVRDGVVFYHEDRAYSAGQTLIVTAKEAASLEEAGTVEVVRGKSKAPGPEVSGAPGGRLNRPRSLGPGGCPSGEAVFR
jgi:hypothetical protein